MLHCVRYVVKRCNSWKWGGLGRGGLNLNPPPRGGPPYPRRPLTVSMFHVEQWCVSVNWAQFHPQELLYLVHLSLSATELSS